jgi:hypothetical protein
LLCVIAARQTFAAVTHHEKKAPSVKMGPFQSYRRLSGFDTGSVKGAER